MIDIDELNADASVTAEGIAERILAWAKHRNLFDKVPLEEGIEEDQNELRIGSTAFQAQAAEQILRKRSINLIGFSEPEKKIVIFTHTKVTKGDEKALPFSISGYKIEYMQGGIAQVKGNPPPPQRPLPFYQRKGFYACGSSIYPAHCTGAGTFGLIVVDANGQLYGLTNNHVSGACNNAMPGLPILAPGPLDATETACDPFTIGRHSRLLPINDGIPENIQIDDNWDASIFALSDPARVTSFQGDKYDTPPNVSDPQPGMRVRKVGRTTALTSGVIVAQSASPVPVAYTVNEYGVKKNVWFKKVFIVVGDDGVPFSRSGDSGSLVVARNAAGEEVAVGLVFAGNEQRGISFILPLADILQRLDVHIVSGHNV
ncbi:S1 family peptidase [Defluviimonas salinarum]|uniref:S1 family peptidase n=1 Tax=Defluviimonas salinarum TaxID=2992147 RepID=A0ABT3J9I1_9RHOB|nr:S1 family peptidase [Defluviimonas salinarum]MCW3784349.1 S1 family peptidase [Defluviimonas salinarum]